MKTMKTSAKRDRLHDRNDLLIYNYSNSFRHTFERLKVISRSGRLCVRAPFRVGADFKRARGAIMRFPSFVGRSPIRTKTVYFSCSSSLLLTHV